MHTVDGENNDIGIGDRMTFGVVKKLVDKYDIFGMIYLGGGSDEYDSETKDIVTRLEKAKTRDQVESSVVEVFEEAFRFSIDEGERELCKQLASEISDLLFGGGKGTVLSSG